MLLYPIIGRSAVGFWAAGIFIDVDHYAWFAAQHGHFDPVAAVRSFNGADAAQHSETRRLHHPLVLGPLLLLGLRRHALLPPALGMALHVALDEYHRARTAEAKSRALRRDRHICRVCGGRDALVAHVWRQPRLLPSYQVNDYVTLCEGCHEQAHISSAVANPDCDWNTYMRRTGLLVRLATTSSL